LKIIILLQLYDNQSSLQLKFYINFLLIENVIYMCVTCNHDFLKHFELSGVVEADEVHAPLPAEVSAVEPVPVLELVPGLTPRQEVMVSANFTV